MKIVNFMKHNYKAFAILLLVLMLICSLIFTTYSWIQRQWSPYIYQEGNISVETGGSIVFQLDKGGSFTSSSITSYYEVENMPLKPVSSLTGARNTFFKIQFEEDESNTPVYKALINQANSGERDDEYAYKNGYIDITLFMQTSETNKATQIYFDPLSHIEPFDPDDVTNVAHTIRVCITINDSQSYLFRKSYDKSGDFLVEDHVAVTDEKIGNNFIADGKDYYSSFENKVVNQDYIKTNSNVHSLNEYMLFVDEETGEKLCDNKPLFEIYKQKVKINIRIWAEGTDEYCDEHIIGEQLSLLLRFVGYVVN